MATKMPENLKDALKAISMKSTSPDALRDNVNTVFTCLYKLPEKKPTVDSLENAQEGFNKVTGLQSGVVDGVVGGEKIDLDKALANVKEKAKKSAINKAQLSEIKQELGKFKGYISESLFQQVDDRFATKIKMMEGPERKTASDSLPEDTSDGNDLVTGNNPDNNDAQDGEIEKKLGDLISSLKNTTDNVSIMDRLKNIYAKYVDLIKLLLYVSGLERVAEDDRFKNANFTEILDKAESDVITDLDLAAIYAVKKVWDPFAQHIKGHSNTNDKQIKKFNESIKKVEKDFNSIGKNLNLFAKVNDRFRIGVTHASSLRVYAKNDVKVSDVIGFLARGEGGYKVEFKDNHYAGQKKSKGKYSIVNNIFTQNSEKGKYCYIPKKKPLEINTNKRVAFKATGKDFEITEIGAEYFTEDNGVFKDLGGRPAKDRFLADF